jgi:endonuclease V-like protein UPF0215 family
LIKKEARILGLAATTKRLKRVPVIGTVYRGNLWLDGIFKCQVQRGQRDQLSRLVRAIVQSKQYSQIHAVILSRENLLPGIRIEISDLSRKINLPVLSIIKKTPLSPRKMVGPQNQQRRARLKVESFRIKIAGRLVPLRAAGLSSEEAREIFAIACASGRWIPEAVRVAQIVAEHATNCDLFPERK